MGQALTQLGTAGKASAPNTPDFMGAFGRQNQTGVQAANQGFNLSNPNQTSAWGSRTVGRDANGNPIISNNLNEADQARLDQQRALMGSLLGGAGAGAAGSANANVGRSLTSGLPGLQYNNADPSQVMNQAENATYNEFARLMEPQQQLAQNQMNTRLAAMGGNTMSPAAGTAMARLLQSQASARQGAANNAVLAGQSAGKNMMDMVNAMAAQNNATQAQGFGQNVTAQNNPLQQMATLLSMTGVQNPNATFGTVAPTQVQTGNAQTAAGQEGTFGLENFRTLMNAGQSGATSANGILQRLLEGAGGSGGASGALGAGASALQRALGKGGSPGAPAGGGGGASSFWNIDPGITNEWWGSAADPLYG
jgi:hypothetical protein